MVRYWQGEARARNGAGDLPFLLLNSASSGWNVCLGEGMDDQEERIIERLTQRVQAELATAAELRRQNDLAEESLKTLKKTQQAEASRNRIWYGISEQTATMVQQLPELALLIHGYDEKLSELEELSERLDRIERALVLVLSLIGEGNRQAKAIVKSIEQDQGQRLIERHKRRLGKLEEKRASYGLETPAHLLLEIEDLEKEIKQLEEG